MRKRSMVLVFVVLLVTSIFSVSENLPCIKVLWWPGPESVAMQKVCDYWNSNYSEKEGFKAQVLLFSREGWWEKMTTALQAGSKEFDIVMTSTYQVENMYDNLFILDEYIKTWDIFIPTSLDAVRYEGNLYAIPTDSTIYVPIYRKDLMTELLQNDSWKQKYSDIAKKYLGKPMLPKEPNDWDWDDFKAFSLFFTKSINSDSPTLYGTALPAKNIIYNVFVWDGVLWSMGGSWFDENQIPALNSPVALEAMKVYTDLMNWGATPPECVNWEFPELQFAMGSGQTAIILQAIAGYNELSNKDSYPNIFDKVGLMKNPGNHSTHLHVLAAGVNKNSIYLDESLSFLSYLATEEALKIYLESGGTPPVETLLESEGLNNEFLSFLSDNISSHAFVEYVGEKPASMEYFSVLSEELSKGWALIVSPEEALKLANKKLEELTSNK